MADLLEVLDVVVAEDADKRGDLWRLQPWVPIPSVASVRPASYPALAAQRDALTGKRFGVPRMFINKDEAAGTSEKPGIGGPTGQRIHTRASVIELWEQARQTLEAAGAEVIEVDFPLVSIARVTAPARRRCSPAAWCPRSFSTTNSGRYRPGASMIFSRPMAIPS
jgi:amidase